VMPGPIRFPKEMAQVRLPHGSFRFVLGFVLAATGLIASALPAAAATDAEVTVGSSNPFSGNKQNEPAVAIDPNHHNLLVAGDNDNIDLEDCNAGADNTCPFTPGVGTTGFQYSIDGGHSWNQPTFTGLSARNCTGVNDPPGAVPTDACVPQQSGPIGTLPKYSDHGLVSDGDPAVAWGPSPGPNGFRWSNGSRLYVANLTSNLAAKHSEGSFKGVEAIGVSRIDVTSAAAATQASQLADQARWMAPSLIPSGTSGFSDKEQIWSDNAASSEFFGNVYVCYGDFSGGPSAGSNSVRLVVARSTDAGSSWSQVVVEKNTDAASGNFGLASGATGCTMRTDSAGTVYLFWHGFDLNTKEEGIFLSRSFDGGATFESRRRLFIVHPTGVFDPVLGRNTMDGIAGARADLSTAPSIDIANGSPTGSGGTDRIVLTWIDGQTLNDEHVRFSTSVDGGNTWTAPVDVETRASDRGLYVAAAISPDGSDAWLVYNAFTTPYQTTTSAARPLVGVVAHADVTGGGVGSFAEVHRSTPGDARGSSQNDLTGEFLGDYVYATATNDFGAFVWNDVRTAADCPAVDAWRAALRTKNKKDDPPTPEPNNDCNANFGNSSIFGAAIADPS
jgi:hypothetical protein